MDKKITINSGIDKDGIQEDYQYINLYLGETVSIVGPTGSGKTALVTDIELLSQGDTITKRTILIDGEIPTNLMRYDALYKPITIITQNTKCFCDLNTNDFLSTHAKARGVERREIVEETIELANRFTGEKIQRNARVTELSGGQTKSLLFADAIKIGQSPIIILDEIENAGINKHDIISNIGMIKKLVIFVTHDPIIALQTKKRIIMKNGSISKVIIRDSSEEITYSKLVSIDQILQASLNIIRSGQILASDILESI